MSDDLVKRLGETLLAMANRCTAPTDLWNEHSNAVLEVAAHIKALEREKAELAAGVERLEAELLRYAEWMMACPPVSDELRAALTPNPEQDR